MARDCEISLCMSCEFRPIDPDIGQPVEGGLKITQRQTSAGPAAVVYSVEDPRINEQFGMGGGDGTTNEAVRQARSCQPVVEGFGISTASFDSQLKNPVNRSQQRACKVAKVLFKNADLPAGLLYQTTETAL